MLTESNVRRGFLEPDGYARLANECAKVGLWLRALFEAAYTFGFRLGELRSMRCRQINFVTGTIALETSKNGEPREAFMTAAVRELLAVLVAGKKPDDFVFTRDDSSQVEGLPQDMGSRLRCGGSGSASLPQLR